jgi:hypothetical protein
MNDTKTEVAPSHVLRQGTTYSDARRLASA